MLYVEEGGNYIRPVISTENLMKELDLIKALEIFGIIMMWGINLFLVFMAVVLSLSVIPLL